MNRKLLAGIAAVVVVSLSLAFLLPGESRDTTETLPWNIAHPTPETIRVFGVTLGQTPLGDAEKALREQAEISLFKPTNGGMAVEAFIEEVNFNGLKAKIVMTVAVPAAELQGMFERGLRLNSTLSGKRVTLSPDDLARVRQAPVATLTYLPQVRLEEAVLAQRFGPPPQRIREAKSGVTHWLYPRLGLDVVMSGGEKPVLQYLPPKDFDRLRAPLLADGELLK